MDFLDPKKQRRNKLTLMVGYVLITFVIIMVTIILKYVADGYSVNTNGQVDLNGLVFVSSQPTAANIYIDNKLYKSRTDTRMVVPSGSYNLKVAATGYRDWQRQISVLGKDVQHFDYPFLFPTTLQTKPLASAVATPQFTSQSPDHRWLLVKPADDTTTLTQYDLKDPAKPVATVLSLPTDIVTAGDGTQSWASVEWSSDNHRVLLLHNYVVSAVASHEYIVLDRTDPTKSVNVTKQLQIPAAEALSLHDKNYDEYYGFDQSTGVLRTLSLSGSLQTEQLNHVVAFKGYGSDMLLYATSEPPTGKSVAGKVSVVLQQGQKTYTLRTLTAGASQYDLDLAQYSGDWYILAGSSSDNGVYVYMNPQDQSLTTASTLPVPWRLLKVSKPTRVSFSSTAQFMMAENGQQFVVYDAENVHTYSFTARQPIDAPQSYALWMDGNRLTYISSGKEVVFDYDYQNVQLLQAALPSFSPSFSSDYKYLFSMGPVTAAAVTTGSAPATTVSDSNQAVLDSTPLVVIKP